MRSAVQQSYQEDPFLIVNKNKEESPLPARRLPALDGLRGLAVIEVFLFHARTPSKNSGWLGVELFLAISGFVITRSLLGEFKQTGRISVWNFIKRRAARIYPALIFLLISYIILGSLLFRKSSKKLLFEVIPSFFGFANWTRAFDLKIPKDLGHLWSLSVELQLYVLWAPLVLWLLRRSATRLASVTMILALGCFLYRYYLISAGSDSSFIYNNTFCRALPFLFGAAAAAISANKVTVGKFSSGLKTLGVILFASALIYHLYELRFCSLSLWPRRNWNPLLVSLSAAIIVWGVSLQLIPAISKFFSTKILFYLGSISYGAFLWHYPIIFLFPRGNPDLKFICAVILSLLMGAVSFELVEKRFLSKN